MFRICLLDLGPVFSQSMNTQSVGPDLQSGVFNKVMLLHLRLVSHFHMLSVFDIRLLFFVQTFAPANTNFSAALLGSQQVQLQKGTQPNLLSTSSGQHENWGESNMAESSSGTNTSTDVDPDDRNQKVFLFLSTVPSSYLRLWLYIQVASYYFRSLHLIFV